MESNRPRIGHEWVGCWHSFIREKTCPEPAEGFVDGFWERPSTNRTRRRECIREWHSFIREIFVDGSLRVGETYASCN